MDAPAKGSARAPAGAAGRVRGFPAAGLSCWNFRAIRLRRIPTGLGHLRSVRRLRRRLMVADVVTSVAEIETQTGPAIIRVLEILAEIADLALRRLVDADDLHLLHDRLPAKLEAEHRRHHHRGRHPFDHVAGHLADLLALPLGVGKPFQAPRFEHHVGKDAVNAVAASRW